MLNKFAKLLLHLAKGNKKLTEEIMDLCFSGLKEFQSKRYRQFFITLSKFMKIDDEMSEWRLRKGLDLMLRASK